PETIVAVHGGMRVIGFSILTDMCLPDFLVPAKIEDILRISTEAGNKLSDLIQVVIPQIRLRG
ncbi:purine-nucleoside phosphorylase, partial [bacterium]|nr:purine-nucleoside phosphorylase [bacterium]